MKRYPNRSMLVLVLAAAAIAQARAQSSVQAQTPTQATGDLANPVAALSLDRLSVTRERPLFSPSRRPPPPPPVPIASAPPPPPPPPNLTLFGVVMDDEDARAVVQTGTGSRSGGCASEMISTGGR
jgi:hypothetical protein